MQTINKSHNSEQQIYLIPKWVHATLQKGKVDIMAYRDYNKVRSVLSLNDLRDWISLDYVMRNIINREDTLIDRNLYTSFFEEESFTKEQQEELALSILPMVDTEENIKYIKNRLSLNKIEIKNSLDFNRFTDGEFYEFVRSTTVVYIVVGKGIIDLLQRKKDFSDFLKTFLNSIPFMSSNNNFLYKGVYRTYLKHLQDNVFSSNSFS